MTADELKRLAIIAGYRFRDDTPEGQFCLSNTTDGWYLSPGEHDEVGSWSCVACQLDWQPHLRIEQAMMVAEAFDCYEIGKDMSSAAPYYCQIFTGIGGRLIGQAISMNLPIAICVAALAAAKEDK